jgi:hypothetical protein
LIYELALPDRREGLFYCRGHGERNPHQDAAGGFQPLRANLALGLFFESDFLIFGVGCIATVFLFEFRVFGKVHSYEQSNLPFITIKPS